ncbi:MAG: NUDIX domain-containing protein [Chloroflexota bacterium]|nr:NUDIX domain-containing protein [Chloroflexota bacterium]
MVWRRQGAGMEFLVLHRAANGPSFAGDWAWGPPSGVLEPGESIAQCAARELFEETGLTLAPRQIQALPIGWPVFLAEAPANALVQLSREHDLFAWVSLDRAAERTMPELVRNQLLTAAREIPELLSARPQRVHRQASTSDAEYGDWNSNYGRNNWGGGTTVRPDQRSGGSGLRAGRDSLSRRRRRSAPGRALI